MAKYRVCEHCGAHLDFGERCDCLECRRSQAGMAEKAERGDP